MPHAIELIGAASLAGAVVHTFCAKFFQESSHRFPKNSFAANTLHLLAEVEIVFGLWGAVFILLATLNSSWSAQIEYLEGLNFTEPLFVFVIMAIAATRPVAQLCETGIGNLARLFPLPRDLAYLFTLFTVGPLLGSFVTEPAAMTVSAVVLRDKFLNRDLGDRLRYLLLGTLFVNISVGGVLTAYAAPPVLMVAPIWKWDTAFMLSHFGWRAALVVFANSVLVTAYYAKIKKTRSFDEIVLKPRAKVPFWLGYVHLFFLALVVLNSHHPVVFIPCFLFFLGFMTATRPHQDDLKLKESLLVAFFLGGVVVLGGVQAWWLAPFVRSLTDTGLFFGATLLTAVLDNAALTYLGAQIPDLTDSFKYALVAGAVTGGGLTVIANAPNPAGFAILKVCFGPDGVSPLKLLVAALIPTLVAVCFFWGI